MEMTAALEALKTVESRKLEGDVEINTDSAYLLQGATAWMYGWAKNGWKTKTGDDVLNRDIWEDIAAVLFRLKSKRSVEFKKVSGHSGMLGNERVDEIATQAADGERVLFFAGNLAEYEKLLGGSVFSGGGDAQKPSGKGSKSKNKSKTTAAYSYVSVLDGKGMSHKTWAECERRVKGKNAKFKKVFSAEEERTQLAEWTRTNA